MSRISEKIREILKLANSSKITDKKKCVAELLDLYQNDDALKEISQNTEQKIGIVNWSHIMHTAHKLILDEAERPSKETSTKNNERQAIISLVINTIRHSNEKSTNLLRSSEMIPMILQILNNKIYIHYQDAYLGILVSYILSKNTNHNNITAEQWKELLIVCTKLYKKLHLKKHIVLDALQMIVEYSFLHTNLLFYIKNLLLFLEKIFEDVKNNNEQLIESYYKLSSTICRQIATESRIALCKFSENIAMDVICLSGSKEKYRLLFIFLQLHHPEGTSKHDNGAYAYDWSKWRDLLRSMCLLIQENCKLDVQWSSFVEFATEVIKQIVDNTISLGCSLETNSLEGTCYQTKRRRIINRMENVVELITESNPEEVQSLLKILTETLRKYPQCLKPQDLALLLQRLTELAQSRDESIMNNLYNLAAVLMESEIANGEEMQDVTIHWSKIWDMLLRSLGANQNEEMGYLLICCFIRYNRMPNANALLRLYLTKAIRWSLNSVRTLRYLCERISLPEDASMSVLDSSPSTTTPICDRTRLLEWLLDVPWQKLATRLPIADMCALSMNLILSSRCRQNIKTDKKTLQSYEEPYKITYMPHKDIYSTDLPQICHASLIFKVDLLANPKNRNIEQNSGVIFNHGNHISYVQDAFNFLKKRLHNIFQEESSNNEVYIMLMKTAFLAKLLSALKLLNVITSENITDYPLIDVMKSYLMSSFEILTRIDPNRSKYTYLLNVTKALSVLYEANYDVDIAKMIVSASTIEMLRNVFDLLNFDDSCRNCDYKEHNTFQERRRYSDVYSPRSMSFSREGVIRLQVVEALALFCALNIGVNGKSTLQTKMMNNLLSMQQDFTNSIDSKMSLTILESLTTYDQSEIQREYADTPLKFLLKYQKDCKDQESLCQLLNLLPYFFKYATEYSYSPEKIIYTLAAFYKRIHQQNCSILVHVNYMKCVCNYIQIDPDFLWSTSNDDVASMLDSVLDYISNELFLLRSQAIQSLQELLSFECIANKWKERIFVKVEEMVFKLFDERTQQSTSNLQNLEVNQQQDEKETRTATALIALTSVACASGFLQGRALHAILRLTVEKELNTQKVQKVLLAVAQHTTTYVSPIEDNLNYLLTTWIRDMQYPLEKFPWMLAGCKSVDEFFRKHINHIVPILLRTLDLTEAISFCINCASMTFDDIFEDVFPSYFTWLISSDQGTFDNNAQQMLWKFLNNTKFKKTRDYSGLLYDFLQKILVELVRRLHDEDDFERILSISNVRFPAMDPPHFTRAIVDRCFDRLECNFLKKSLNRILVEQPAVLQKTLLCLVNAIYSSRFPEGQLKRLYQYVYFCSRLTRDLAKPFFDKMAAFLIRDICYSLLHLTRNNNEVLVTACCKFLDLFLRLVLPMRTAEVRDILRFIVTNLISLAQKTNQTGNIAANLLRFLIVEQKSALWQAIAKLSSFPDCEIFRDARETHNIVRSKKNGVVLCLDDELERFLNAIDEENAECTFEDLADLSQQLSTKKKELRELHRKERLYSEDGTNILHRLVFKLIKLIESSNSRISMEATKCLGELGPTDSTMTLRPIINLIQEADHAVEALTYRSVSLLTTFLVKNTVELRKVSADALYAVLSTSYGRKLSDPEHVRNLSNIFKECAPLKIDYIQPFCHERYVTQSSFHVNIAKFRIVMDPENALWIVQDSVNYTEWIVKTTCSLAECFMDSYLESFLPVCRFSTEFCELILPRILYLLIYQNDSFICAMCDCINQFFRYHFVINHETQTTSSRDYDGKIVHCMLDVVKYIRTQLPDGTSLKLDYIYLAKAAHECSAYYTALLFTQLACESISTDYPDFSSDSRIDYIYEHQSEFGRVLQNIMLDTYMNISHPDAISGAGSSHLLDHNSRIQYYAGINNWDKVMLAQDIELSYNNNHLNKSPLINAKMMANALHHSGLQFLQSQFLGNCLDEKFSYECAWRLSNWNLPINDNVNANYNDFKTQSRLEQLENAFHVHHYHALKCFHENDRQSMERAIESARKSVIYSLRIISLESNRTVNEKLSQLRLLREIEQLSSAADSSEEKYPEVLQSWNEHQISLTSEFNYIEPILWQRITMFRIRESLWTDSNVQTAFFITCLDLAKIAESQGNFPVAARALGTLMKHGNLSVDLQNQLLYQESLLAWMKCDQVIARRLLRSLIEKRNPKPDLRAKALRVYGDWMAETKSENPQAVIQKYYLESIETSEAIENQTPDVVKNLHNTQVALARFADAQYEQITAYMNSPIYESLKEYARGNDVTDKMDQAQIMKNYDLKRAMIINQKQSTNDAAELKNIEQEKRKYLAQALMYYLKTLQRSEEHNMLIFRLVALWLDNMLDEEVNEVLLNEINTVPSFKFIPLVPQLAAHISNDLKQQGSFTARIFEILERCALDHPYHTLPVLLALKNLHSDDEYDLIGKITKKEERRVLGAKKLLKRLADSSVSAIVYEMESLSRALLSLAYWQPKGKCYPGKSYQISRDQPISKIKNLSNVLLPTLNLSVRPSGNYNDVIGVRMYQDTCEFVGGVNAPKKIICVGTDGMQRRQLIKGKDDLRQDAVMQQVFTVMNALLCTCKETKRRNLRIRTYKVVPLTQRSGVLEWCDNTLPISAVLMGNSGKVGMHKKYYPRDLTAEMAREKLKSVAQESNQVKLKVFLECCKKMRPAFHHFFEEKYRSPETWVERTLTYTRSVAITSIAGYILGLGDRHLSNILIDERTAEVVHIDFGVAFEQGKVLPVPETIPFRLTRDIEVAMGVSGIEGTMRRSCEVTMTMLRDQRQIIITLLQVLLYDPLFTWAITPEKACKMQSDVLKRDFSENNGRALIETNKIAKRALLRIEQKLRGTEDGLVSSVPGQVERLLQEARDPMNLCRVYCGWQPYL